MNKPNIEQWLQDGAKVEALDKSQNFEEEIPKEEIEAGLELLKEELEIVLEQNRAIIEAYPDMLNKILLNIKLINEKCDNYSIKKENGEIKLVGYDENGARMLEVGLKEGVNHELLTKLAEMIYKKAKLENKGEKEEKKREKSESEESVEKIEKKEINTDRPESVLASGQNSGSLELPDNLLGSKFWLKKQSERTVSLGWHIIGDLRYVRYIEEDYKKKIEEEEKKWPILGGDFGHIAEKLKEQGYIVVRHGRSGKKIRNRYVIKKDNPKMKKVVAPLYTIGNMDKETRDRLGVEGEDSDCYFVDTGKDLQWEIIEDSEIKEVSEARAKAIEDTKKETEENFEEKLIAEGGNGDNGLTYTIVLGPKREFDLQDIPSNKYLTILMKRVEATANHTRGWGHTYENFLLSIEEAEKRVENGVLTIKVPKDLVGKAIGKGGRNVKFLQNELNDKTGNKVRRIEIKEFSDKEMKEMGKIRTEAGDKKRFQEKLDLLNSYLEDEEDILELPGGVWSGVYTKIQNGLVVGKDSVYLETSIESEKNKETIKTALELPDGITIESDYLVAEDIEALKRFKKKYKRLDGIKLPDKNDSVSCYRGLSKNEQKSGNMNTFVPLRGVFMYIEDGEEVVEAVEKGNGILVKVRNEGLEAEETVTKKDGDIFKRAKDFIEEEKKEKEKKEEEEKRAEEERLTRETRKKEENKKMDTIKEKAEKNYKRIVEYGDSLEYVAKELAVIAEVILSKGKKKGILKKLEEIERGGPTGKGKAWKQEQLKQKFPEIKKVDQVNILDQRKARVLDEHLSAIIYYIRKS